LGFVWRVDGCGNIDQLAIQLAMIPDLNAKLVPIPNDFHRLT
jgi:hypothetical protein